MAAMAVTLLHLSDLHFAEPGKGHYWNSDESTEKDLDVHERKGVLGRLLDDPMLAKTKPEIVVISGDLLDKAQESGVPLALEFLRGLATRLSLPPERFVLVPGNHDLSRSPGVGYRHFDDIYQGFYGSTRPSPAGKPAHERVDLFDLPEFNITIAGFNSCEGLHGGHEHGHIGEGQRENMGRLLAKADSRPLRIAVMHHHLEQAKGQLRPDLSVMNDPQGVRAWLRANGFALVLHGHQHVDWQTTSESDDWRLTIASAGSLGVGRYGREDWGLRLCYQSIVIWNLREGLRVRREYSEGERKWGEAGAGTDGRNRPRQPLRFGSLRGSRQPASAAVDGRRFASVFGSLLRVTPDVHQERIVRHKETSERGCLIDILELCQDLREILELLSGRERRDFADAAKRLLCRVVLDVPLTPSPSALPPIRLYTTDLETVPVATYLYLAILVAHAQGSPTVQLKLDPKVGLVGTDGLSPGLLAMTPTLKNATEALERILWEAVFGDKTVPYEAKCDCDPLQCREYRMLGDLDECNQNCRRFLLYARLEGRSDDGHRLFATVDASAGDQAAWSEIASSITCISLLRLGSKGAGQRPPNEDRVHYALTRFFEMADEKQGKRVSR
jgi:3',5'-cyclic AMP phosphodiesterase CpdA